MNTVRDIYKALCAQIAPGVHPVPFRGENLLCEARSTHGVNLAFVPCGDPLKDLMVRLDRAPKIKTDEKGEDMGIQKGVLPALVSLPADEKGEYHLGGTGFLNQAVRSRDFIDMRFSEAHDETSARAHVRKVLTQMQSDLDHHFNPSDIENYEVLRLDNKRGKDDNAYLRVRYVTFGEERISRIDAFARVLKFVQDGVRQHPNLSMAGVVLERMPAIRILVEEKGNPEPSAITVSLF